MVEFNLVGGTSPPNSTAFSPEGLSIHREISGLSVDIRMSTYYELGSTYRDTGRTTYVTFQLLSLFHFLSWVLFIG